MSSDSSLKATEPRKRLNPFFSPGSTFTVGHDTCHAPDRPTIKIRKPNLSQRNASFFPAIRPEPPKEANKIHPFFANVKMLKEKKEPIQCKKSPTVVPMQSKTASDKEKPRSAAETCAEIIWPDKRVFQGGHVFQHEVGTSRDEACATWADKQYVKRNAEVIRRSSQKFFSTPCRERDVAVKKQSARYFSKKDIEELMDFLYPSAWGSDACQVILHSMFNCAPSSQPGFQLWTDKYRPHRVLHLLGNKSRHLYFQRWLRDMKVSTASKQMEDRSSSQSGADGFLARYDIDWNHHLKSNIDSERKFKSNMIVLFGEHGAGKTASVYTAAEEEGYQVFEIYAGMKRSGKDVAAAVGEMTQSHQVKYGGKRMQTRKDISALFDAESDQTMDPKQSLILLEEADLLFEQDKGFWSVVMEIAETSKRPIVITCNDLSAIPLHDLFIQAVLPIEALSEKELLPYLQLVCLAEGYLVPKKDLSHFMAAIGTDLRKLLITLQCWCKQKQVCSGLEKEGKLLVHECSWLFAEYMGIRDFVGRADRLTAEDWNRLLQAYSRSLGSKRAVDTVRLCMHYLTDSWETMETTEPFDLQSIGIGLDMGTTADIWSKWSCEVGCERSMSYADCLFYDKGPEGEEPPFDECMTRMIYAFDGAAFAEWRSYIKEEPTWDDLCHKRSVSQLGTRELHDD
ncbi:hypothetical protein EC973_005616 [Apophysomyces ossiformis]|uniref:ATPase AAA-type core domain-containing protein n=1 Tax=Apophysomyces ossiformis TaxID=679940 RepID=A0A8H7BW58_9FUNG|nr:hypothetical protein EC973_005616 [Apophysomyces ossiformis]